MKNNLYLFILLLLIIFSSISMDPGYSGSDKTAGGIAFKHFAGFMKADGKKFSGNFKFLGANLDPWRFITEDGEIYSYNEMRTIVKNARDYIGAKVIRMHINGGAFEPAIGNYSEETFRQLDYLVAACVEYKVYILIALRDYLWTSWPNSSVGTYVEYDPYWYLAGGTKNSPNKDAILTDAGAKAAFKNFINYVLNRVNTVTKVAYKDETNILGWELINEPNLIPGVTGAWLDEMRNYVKSIDPNHLVGFATFGVEGGWFDTQTPWNEINVPSLDFISIHYYADASLYNPVNAANAQKISDRVARVLSFGKPCIVDEFGCFNTTPLQTIKNLYTTVITNSFAAGASGVMPYSWGPPGPHYWGGKGGYNIYTDDTELCNLLKNLAP